MEEYSEEYSSIYRDCMEELLPIDTILVNKNKINHPAPLPNFSQLRKINLPGFKKFYSEELFDDANLYMTDKDIKEQISFLTVFGIKYKYLNRKKCFPAKLTDEQLKLKKAFVCLEILKVTFTCCGTEKFKQICKQLVYGTLEKIKGRPIVLVLLKFCQNPHDGNTVPLSDGTEGWGLSSPPPTSSF